MESLAKLLFDFDKLPARLVMIVFFLSAILLFVPPDFLQKIQLAKFNESFGHWVGISFISSMAFLIVSIITSVNAYFKTNSWRKEYKENIRQSIINLDPLERSILREFFLQGGWTINMPMDHPSVVGLQDKHIIRIPQSQTGSYFINGTDMPFTLTDEAKKVLMPNLTLIGMKAKIDPNDQEEKQRLLGMRPPWIRNRF